MRAALALGLSLSLALSSCAARSPHAPLGHPKQATPARVACAAADDCTLRSRDPCSCGVETARDVEAVAARWADAHPQSLTGSCPDCLHESNPSLYPTCRSGRCAVLALDTSPLTRCADDTECVSVPNGCCPPCSASAGWVGVRHGREAALARQLCGRRLVTCPACAGGPPPAASCVSGHCVAGRGAPGMLFE